MLAIAAKPGPQYSLKWTHVVIAWQSGIVI
jgi:hypothetical protein